ncbi:MAG: zinc-binding alcohol dehydrogenase family protein, partial [Pseudonocardiales bacterium]|nr:zinc-binding alcohol dehydrogenase family protein [Pseudonocardiales bacterium]
MTPAAVVEAPGAAPVPGERPDPVPGAGEVLVRVTAAPITPLDRLCATGTSYFGTPAVPYVPGVQGVGTTADGTPVWFATSAGMAPGDGSMRGLVAVPEADLVVLPDGADPVLVAALGLSAVAAWCALTRTGGLTEGETVVVLGAGGVVGQAGVQLARLAGAGRIVAAARSADGRERAIALGA